jgi:penicillin-insensitive murein endopeptidase
MRLSRNRNWGTPQLLRYLERLASDARALDGRPGLLFGDMAQPRKGPMITGHSSHQIGLDADVWLTPMPTASSPLRSVRISVLLRC